jgi:hypothetical protein
MNRNGYSIRRPTHISQNAVKNIQVFQDFVDYANSVCTELEIPASNIVNMDQTPVPFDLITKTTIIRTGAKTVSSRKPKTTGGNNATACLAVTAVGKKLPAYIIFKGTSKGRLARYEMPQLNDRECGFGFQEKNWCDEKQMLLLD